MTLKLQFDPNQDYQIDAIAAAVDLFEGLPRQTTEYRLEDVIPNLPLHEDLSEAWLFRNLRTVQERHGLQTDRLQFELEMDEGLGLVGTSTARFPHFTVEMETGTGKTYVYLRTIYELRRRYGFGKFIIVVPSIAIFEGVLKNFDITRDHFRALYGNEVVNVSAYDGSQLSRLRSFAASAFAEVMVMTLDSFNKASNVIYKPSEKLPGQRLPYQYIQETRPILILDEPQNMGSDLARRALWTLNPLFALRYSATHRETPNLVYRLTPFDAYRRNLVKKIQISGVTQREDVNRPFLGLESISRSAPYAAKVRTYVLEKGRTREATVSLRQGDDLHDKTGRDEHQGGYVVSEIHAGAGFVEFENGVRLRLDDTIGPNRPEIFRAQIEETIARHLDKQAACREQGIKVLSLFFIDRVANYVDENGLIKTLFDRAFNKLKKRDPVLVGLRPEDVRSAYFAKKKLKSGEEQTLDTNGSNKEEREAEKAAFELILRDKERLLSFEEPVSFIFAHSALKEGWDNPNVFQICSLNQAVSTIRRRQEIGRGLRLSVDQTGERVFGEDVNVLTVIANESYAAYAGGLQTEYTDDGDMAPPAPTDATRKPALRNDKIYRQSPDFREFWRRLAQRATYRIELDTDALIETCLERLNNATFPEPLTIVETGAFVQARYTLTFNRLTARGPELIIESDTSDGDKTSITRAIPIGTSVGKILKDEALNPYTVVEVRGTGDKAEVVFGNQVTLALQATHTFAVQAGKVKTRASLAPQTRYPVFNLIDRTARETGVTRPTAVAIFKGLTAEQKQFILRNPEGFAGVFITEIQNAVADLVAESIVFEIRDDDAAHDLDAYFPASKVFPQRELVVGGEHGLYDHIQVDSDVERAFLDKLKPDESVALYFKFPPTFKIKLPRLIGNYNPDWGIVRRRDDGQFTVHLIRETKGGTLEKLRFPHEKRKVRCAGKYFEALDMDYRQIEPPFADWWRLVKEVHRPEPLIARKKR